MEERTRDVIDYVAIVVGFAGMITALIGEWLGWWNDFGVLLGGLSLMVSVTGLFDVVGRSVRRSVHPLPAMITGVGEKVDGLGEKVDGLGDKVDGLGEKVDGLGDKVDGLGEKIDVLGVKVDALGDGQAESNQHLVRIATILEERLPRGG